ncbi:hypothetical protein KR054_011804 [Drosophila jambulina]|nr:hypothetical protein KR054_011804 [Drosophila jambulina]
MSKKMWNKIFKSKSQKPQQPLAKINKRHSRGIYEEYQQLNDLLAGEKAQLNFSDQGQNEKENEHGNGNGNGCGNGNGNGNGNCSINVFEQQPRQSSFNSLEFSEAHQQQQYQQSPQQQQQQQQLSTFSRVRNTFSLRRGNNNNKKQLLNAKSSESATPPEMGAAPAANADATVTAAAATAATLTNQSMQRVLIVVNKIDVATNHQTNHLHANPTVTATTAVKPTTSTATTDPGVSDSMQGADEDPLPPPPPPLTTGSPLPIPEHAPPQSSGDLTPCPCCSRTFNLDALRKHIVICEKTSKKRKVFDSSRQRRDGTALSTYVLPKNFGLPNAERTVGVPVPPAAVSTSAVAAPAEVSLPNGDLGWNLSQSFPRSTARASLRKAASTLSNSSSIETPPAAPVAPPATSVRERSQAKRIKAPACDRCPHCERTFNPKAFDRHVEWCKEKAIQANMKSGNSQETSKAKERLEARKQYKPPNLKTKRSVARDKYSGNHEELLEAGDMSASKPSMMSLSMTSSVHSDNAKVTKPRTSPAASKESLGRPGTMVTQNQVKLDMSNEEDVPSSPASSVRASTSSRRLSKRQQFFETCSEIDDAMDRIKRNSLKMATLDCEDAPVLQPKAKTGRTVVKRGKAVEAVDKELSLPDLPQVTMTFDELNGLIKRKGGTPICNAQMDEREVATLTTKQSSGTSASMVRQARRRISTRESPNPGLQSLQRESLLAKNADIGSFDSSLVSLQRSSNYSGSDDDDVNSPRAEIQIQLEATTMRTVCRPQKRSGHGGHMTKNSEPMRALPITGLKQSLDAINKSMGQTVLPRLELGNKRPEYDQHAEDEDNYNSDLDYEEEEGPMTSFSHSRSQEVNPRYEQEEEEEEKPLLRLPPLAKQNSNMSCRLVVEQDENGTVYIKSSPKAKRSGLGDKYDPFLSAKRQLEELCSPSTPPPEEEVTTSRSVMTPTATATPSIAMTTSLTSSGSSKPVQTKTTTPTSNFRRTSSLRGPRRNAPLLNSRPLFATNYRPTIQRGLSDEGPISTNFLKPEEYDEMPVRAACGNDFHSPRVVRRDTSASNRKQPLKLPVSGTNEGGNASSSVQPTRTVAKTDSLAVFLKYEHELEQLNAKAAELATASQLTSKELKDKSNTLSKQNSAKNLGQSTPTQLPPLTPTGAVPPSPTLAKENHYPPIATPLRLEPISSKPSMMVNQQPPPLTPIKLESIFGPKRELGSVSGAGSVAGDYIDPKLINACDNLHVNSGISSDASSTPQQLSQSRSRSSSQSTITHERRQSGEARNLLKRKMRLGRNQFLYDASPEDADASGCSADDEANRSSMEYDEQCWQQQQKQLLANPLPLVMPMVHSAMPTFDDFDFEEFLSSFENENDDEQFPLFKDCREFLLNRSTSRHRSFQKAATSTPQTATQQINPQPHSQQSKSKDNYAHATHRSDAGSQSQPEERLQRQQSNASRACSSHEEKQSRFQEVERRADVEDQQKREIFISIETEANAQGRSPISPESLRHMVGNSQTPIDVLHIENGNEPEHARFSKISDTEDAGHESGDRASQLGSNANTNRLAQSLSASTLAPNVQLNNAKNLMQQMQSDFRQLGEEASASVRRQLMLNSGRLEEHQQQQQQFRDQEAGQQQQHHHQPQQQQQFRDMETGQQHHHHQQQQQQHVKANSPLTPSPSADSDELSSLDGYPMSSSQSSRRGASSKLSSDSAYGSSNSPYSLSRQRSSELQPLGGSTHRSQGLLRPHTASAKLPSTTSDASTQAQTQYGTLKARQRLFGNGGSACGGSNGNGEAVESSSSGSEENSQQPIQQQQQQASNYNYQQQQQYQQSQPAYSVNNNNIPMTPTISQHSLLSNTSNNSMSSSMKMSKFCHECGAKFIIEHAKFCMDCGVRRMVL